LTVVRDVSYFYEITTESNKIIDKSSKFCPGTKERWIVGDRNLISNNVPSVRCDRNVEKEKPRQDDDERENGRHEFREYRIDSSIQFHTAATQMTVLYYTITAAKRAIAS